MSSSLVASSSVRITALTRDNYFGWKTKMMSLLIDARLWGVASGTTVRPVPTKIGAPTPEEEKQIADWDLDDQRALAAIILRVSDDYLVYLDGLPSAKAAWDKLKNIFESKGSLTVTNLWRRLYRLQATEDTLMEDHIRQLQEYLRALRNRGESIEDRTITNIIFASLPEIDFWENFTTSITTARIQLSSDDLIGEVLETDRRRRENKKETVLKAREGRNNNREKSNKATKKICNNCGIKGHLKESCWAKGGGKEGQAPEWYKPKDKKDKEKDSAKQSTENDDFAFMGRISTIESSDWLSDSAATVHICNDRQQFITFRTEPSEISGITPQALRVFGIGTVELNMETNGKIHKTTLRDVKYAPDAPNNLLSIGRLTGNGHTAIFTENGVQFRSKNGTIFAEGTKIYNMFKMKTSPINNNKPTDFAFAARSWDDWHRTLGHIHMGAVKHMHKSGVVTGMEVDERSTPSQCTACIQGKAHIAPFPQQASEQDLKPAELIVADVWGPANITGTGGSRYYFQFMDVKTRYTVVYFGKEKSEALTHFKHFKAWIELQSGNKILRYRTDNGKEFDNADTDTFLKKCGIIHEFSAPYSQAQNGMPERGNRTNLEGARSMIYAKDLPKKLWPEAVAYMVYIRNRSPTRALGGKLTPFEALFGRKPNISRLREFGTRCWVMVPAERRKKLDPKAEEHIFAGIAEFSKAWKYYNTKTGIIQVSRNITFSEDDTQLYPIPGEEDDDDEGSPTIIEGEESRRRQGELPKEVQKPAQPQEALEPNEEEATQSGDDAESAADAQNLTRESRRLAHKPRQNYAELNDPWRKQRNKSNDKAFAVRTPDIIIEPQNFEELASREDHQIWEEAMQTEMDQHMELQTWYLTDLPDGRLAIGCRWVYAVKTDENGAFEKAKARLVAQGFTQRPGMDYFEITSPVAKFDSLRTVLAYANQYDLEIHGMDVKGAYLNAPLEEEIYMRQPPGFNDGTGRVLRLNLNLYGLKQAGRRWNQKFTRELINLGYHQSSADECVFIRSKNGHKNILVVYVDDLAVIADTMEEINKMKQELKNLFQMTDLGPLTKILGLKIDRDRTNGTLKISQGPYIDLILERFEMTDCHLVATPMDKNSKLHIPEKMDLHEDYAKMIGSLMYAALGTRPDIAFTVQHLSKFTNNHDKSHRTAVKRVFRYLKGTRDVGIIFKRNPEGLNFRMFVDADFANLPDAKSVSGYASLIGGGCATWSAKKQPIVALSTTEAEYIALTHGGKQLTWLRKLLFDLGEDVSQEIPLYCDNLGAITISKDNSYHARTKHINIRYHYIRGLIASHEVDLTHVTSEDNAADIFTKALDKQTHRELMTLLGMGELLR